MAFGADTAIELSAIAGAETFGAQSISLLMADLHQDMNGGFLLIFSFGIIYQFLNRAIPLRKCSIKSPPT